MTLTPRAAAASESSTSMLIGFSSSTCHPFSSAAMVRGACVLVMVDMTTASSDSAGSANTSSGEG
jgi:hypothetical protein